MEVRPPVIVAGNRYGDIEGYSTRIYHEQPDLWGSIFPWEFPQNGTKDEEERFLRKFFTETETQVQGFRFLKQVWYCIALFNLNHRIPAFTKWWLSKPSSVEYLSEPAMHPYLLDNQVKPAALFPDELSQYGEKFLAWVIPHLQHSVKELLEKGKDKKTSSQQTSNTLVPEHGSRHVSAETAQSVDSTGHVVNTTVSMPSPKDPPLYSSAIVPQSAPPHMTSPEQVRPRVIDSERPVEQSRSRAVSNDYPAQQEPLVLSRKRGNSASKRFNNRAGAQFQSRHQPPPQDHGMQSYQSPIYASNTAALYGHPRGPSGPAMDFVQSVPQGRQMPPVPHHSQYTPIPQGYHPQFQQQPIPQDMYYAPSNVQGYFGPPFNDRSNFQPPDRGVFDERQAQYYHDQGSFRGSHRRDSQGSRGAKSRGGHGFRGKNSRGRNSFTGADQSRPFAMQAENMHPGQFEDYSGYTHSSRQRRGSVYHEKTWRSGSDNPQTWESQPNLENVHQATVGNHTMSLVPQPRKMGTVDSQDTQRPQHPVRGYPQISHDGRAVNSMGSVLPIPDLSTLTRDETCDRDWIGEKCTYVDKLIVFDVPLYIPLGDIRRFFSSLAEVKDISRPKAVHPHNPESSLVFLGFFDTQEARKCMLSRPAKWLDGQNLRLEVAKQFWDPTHWSYIFGPQGPPTPYGEATQTPVRVPSILKRIDDGTTSTRVPSIGQSIPEDSPSTDVTPTQSGSTTPKKKKPSKPRKSKKKQKEKEDLRKASLTAKDATDSRPTLDISNDSASALTPVGHGSKQEIIWSSDANRRDSLHAINSDKGRSASQQTEIQTTSEPAFSPTDIIETRLPMPSQAAQNALSTLGSAGLLQPDSARTEHETTSEIAFSPAVDIITRLPEQSRPFREAEETATQKAEDAGVDKLQEGARAEKHNDQPKAAETPGESDEGHVDDSFHTAAGSPGHVGNSIDKSDAARMDSDALTTSASKLGAPGDMTTEGSAQSESGKMPSSPDSAISPKSAKKVHVPQLAARNRLTSRSSSSTIRPEALVPPTQPVLAVSPALPTPAYFTAPNTPAVPQWQSGQLLAASEVETTDNDAKQAKSVDLKADTSKVKEVSSTGLETEKTREAKAISGVSGAKEGQAVEAEAVAVATVNECSKVETKVDKKKEKAKGPAQTESFSFFSRSKEKKPKAGKKGTLKGKPNLESSAASDTTTGTMSRAVSGVSTPEVDTITAHEQSTSAKKKKKTGGQDKSCAEAKIAEESRNARKTSQDTERAMAEDLVAPPPPQPESPSKRKGLSSLLSGLFSGGQQSKPSSKSDDARSSKNMLTDNKAQDRPQEEVTKQSKDVIEPSDVGLQIEDEAPGVLPAEAERKAPGIASEPVHASEDIDMPAEAMQTAASEIGLGISNEGEEAVQDDPKPKKKAKSNSKKKKSKSNEAEASEQDQQFSTPTSESKPFPGMFRFGEDNPALLPMALGGDTATSVVTSPHLDNEAAINGLPVWDVPRPSVEDADRAETVADGSDLSSRTAPQGRETPSSDMQSPTLSTPANVRSRQASTGGQLVEAKNPTWKKQRKKRPKQNTEASEATSPEVDGEITGVVTLGDCEDDSSNEENDEPQPPKKLYIYVGRGLREEIDGSEPNTTAKIQHAAREVMFRDKLKRTNQIDAASDQAKEQFKKVLEGVED